MATYKKTALRRLTYLVDMEGESFHLIMAALDTPQLLDLSATMLATRRKIRDAGVDADTYRELLAALGGHVKGVEGLDDEDGIPVDWEALCWDDQFALLSAISFASVMELTGKYVSAERLNPGEKKASPSTSSPSTPETSAAAPSAPQAEPSPGSSAAGPAIQPG